MSSGVRIPHCPHNLKQMSPWDIGFKLIDNSKRGFERAEARCERRRTIEYRQVRASEDLTLPWARIFQQKNSRKSLTAHTSLAFINESSLSVKKSYCGRI